MSPSRSTKPRLSTWLTPRQKQLLSRGMLILTCGISLVAFLSNLINRATTVQTSWKGTSLVVSCPVAGGDNPLIVTHLSYWNRGDRHGEVIAATPDSIEVPMGSSIVYDSQKLKGLSWRDANGEACPPPQTGAEVVALYVWGQTGS